MASCVILLSGGLDSAVTLAMVRELKYDKVYALSFDYGQRHKVELNCAIAQALAWKVDEHRIISLDLGYIGGSSLTDRGMEVPKDRHVDGFNWEVPSTYVPARNAIFLSFALAWAEVLGVEEIYIGANSLDFSGYPDCRPEFFRSFERMSNLATPGGVEGKRRFRIKTPLITMSKEEIVSEGIRLKVDFSRTFSCYDPDGTGQACGHCDACKLRLEGFKKAGAADPVRYTDEERSALLKSL